MRLRILYLLTLLVLVGCSNLPLRFGGDIQAGTAEPAWEPSATFLPAVATEQIQITPKATPSITQESAGSLLRIWLPPEFDPEGDSLADKLLKSRLEQFAVENPGVRLEVRVKSLTGTGGMLDALSAAHVSAPLALPDLVLLSRPMLESAALKDLILPYDDVTNVLGDQNWFPYAQQLARVDSGVYGLPFAGDALVLAYRPSQTGITPRTLEEILSLGTVLVFPAADPQALFILNTYLDAGGSLQDDAGRPMLDEATLVKVLDFAQRASVAGMMPPWLTQYIGDVQVWEAFMANQYPMAVTWASTFLQNNPDTPEDLVMAPLPVWEGVPITLANGWSWALTGQDPTRREQSISLAKFLLEKDFLASWTRAAGYLPPTEEALQGWQDASQRRVIGQVSDSAQLMPPADQVSSLGPALAQALVSVLKAENVPVSAAKTAIDQLNQP